MSKISVYTGKKYREMHLNYMKMALHPVNVPYPYQYRDMKLRGNRFKYDTLAVRLGLFMTDKELEVSEFRDMCNIVSGDSGIKMNNSDIHNYLHGRDCPKHEKLKLMADTMGVTEEWLTAWRSDAAGVAMSDPAPRFMYKGNYGKTA